MENTFGDRRPEYMITQSDAAKQTNHPASSGLSTVLTLTDVLGLASTAISVALKIACGALFSFLLQRSVSSATRFMQTCTRTELFRAVDRIAYWHSIQNSTSLSVWQCCDVRVDIASHTDCGSQCGILSVRSTWGQCVTRFMLYQPESATIPPAKILYGYHVGTASTHQTPLVPLLKPLNTTAISSAEYPYARNNAFDSPGKIFLVSSSG